MSDEWKSSSSSGEDAKSWKLLEKALLSSVQEQRRSRRWGIFFKLLTFFYLFGAALVAFVSEAIKAFGARSCLIAGTFAMAVAAVAIAIADNRANAIGADAQLDILGGGRRGEGGGQRNADKGKRGDEGCTQQFGGHDRGLLDCRGGRSRRKPESSVVSGR